MLCGIVGVWEEERYGAIGWVYHIHEKIFIGLWKVGRVEVARVTKVDTNKGTWYDNIGYIDLSKSKVSPTDETQAYNNSQQQKQCIQL